MNPVILFTVDVEDWFQVENFKDCIPFSSWKSCELRVEKNVYRLLDLFDDFINQQQVIPDNPNNSRATFFILGWIAERLPHLVREIHARGHEVASHGFNHGLCDACSIEELKQDFKDSKKLLEDIIGAEVYGYRAPSFSISDEILKIIQECGYLYDSSYNSFGLHGRYGKISITSSAKTGIAYRIPTESNGEGPSYEFSKQFCFYELPISNLNIKNLFRFRTLSTSSVEKIEEDFVLPWGGGGYFRLIPFPIFKMGVGSILKQDEAYLFYCHPWEIDPDQPRVKMASGFSKFRHYLNLRKSYERLRKFIAIFGDCEFSTCRQYLERWQ